MTESERRYKILKRTSYEEQISEQEKIATKESFWFGLSAAAAMCTFSVAANANTEDVLRLTNTILGITNTVFSAGWLKRVIDAISAKTMFRNRVLDIDMELSMDEQVCNDDMQENATKSRRR